MMWEIGAYLGDASDSYAQLPMAQHRFRTIFREKAALLVCDDVLDAQDAYPFILDGPRCSLLLTTRDNAIAVKLGGRTVSIDTFAQQQALQLLAADSGLSITELPSEASEIAYECGLHPLALSVVAALAKSQGSSRRAWAEILETLREGHLPAIEG